MPSKLQKKFSDDNNFGKKIQASTMNNMKRMSISDKAKLLLIICHVSLEFHFEEPVVVFRFKIISCTPLLT